MVVELENNARELTQDEIRSALAKTKTITEARAGLFRQLLDNDDDEELPYELGKNFFFVRTIPFWCASLYLANSLYASARARVRVSLI